ncbi:MAG: carbohydrate kinase family protein [Candidatus Nanohaloarchaea archaeon]
MESITCVGELLVDMIGQEEKSIKENPAFSKRAGGAPANVAVAASRLGADVTKVATVGDDEFGDFLVEKLERENVDVSRVMRSDSKTTLAHVALDSEAKPHFEFYRGADEEISEEQLDLQLDSSDIVHICSLPLTDPGTAERLIRFVEETPARVSFDPNLREDIMNDGYADRLEQLLEHVDMLTAAEEEIDFFGGLEKLRREIDEIIVTRGEYGAELYHGDDSYRATPPEVDVVDTTGAGDALTGAYLAFHRAGRKQALEKAVKAAAISTTSKGAMSSLPEKSELE